VKRFLIKADKVVEKVGDWAMVVSGILVLLIGLLTSYGVGKRYIFHNPDPYSYEMSIIFLVACILLSLPGIQWQRRNLRVDWILSHFSPRWQGIVGDVFTTLLGMVFVGIIIWKSWGIFRYSISVGQSSQSAWQEPLWPMQLLVPICMAWLWITLLSQLIHAIVHAVKGTVREDLRVQFEDAVKLEGTSSVQIEHAVGKPESMSSQPVLSEDKTSLS
jgi:TRAP-type mannitol/chloroaromatic compound transport system permease small subunit